MTAEQRDLGHVEPCTGVDVCGMREPDAIHFVRDGERCHFVRGTASVELDAGDVHAIAAVLDQHAGCVANDSRSVEWVDGSGITGVDVWSCGLHIPFVDDIDAMERMHFATALAAHVTRRTP